MRPKNIEEYILYEDKEIIVCRKPAGMPVQTSGIGTMDMESALRNYRALKEPGKIPYIGVVHRLDQPVEGIIVFARTSQAAGKLSRQIGAKGASKIYLAVTEHKPETPEGILEDYLKKNGKANMSQVVAKGTPGAKKARLSYKLIKENKEKSRYLIEIHLETGRHHQIRVQMEKHGMPLLGDRKYNPQGSRCASLGLCACSLEFDHPASGKRMKFRTDPKGQAFEGFEM